MSLFIAVYSRSEFYISALSYCPERWTRKGSVCYRLSSQTFSKKEEAANKCRTFSQFSALANVTSEEIRKNVSDLLGPRKNYTEIWVDQCMKGKSE